MKNIDVLLKPTGSITLQIEVANKHLNLLGMMNTISSQHVHLKNDLYLLTDTSNNVLSDERLNNFTLIKGDDIQMIKGNTVLFKWSEEISTYQSLTCEDIDEIVGWMSGNGILKVI